MGALLEGRETLVPEVTPALIDDRITDPMSELPTDAVMRSVRSSTRGRLRAGASAYIARLVAASEACC